MINVRSLTVKIAGSEFCTPQSPLTTQRYEPASASATSVIVIALVNELDMVDPLPVAPSPRGIIPFCH